MTAEWNIGSDDEEQLATVVGGIVARNVAYALRSVHEEVCAFIFRDPETGDPALLIGFGETTEGLIQDASVSLRPVLEELNLAHLLPAFEVALDEHGYTREAIRERNEAAKAKEGVE
jgi:hypothetical protein